MSGRAAARLPEADEGVQERERVLGRVEARDRSEDEISRGEAQLAATGVAIEGLEPPEIDAVRDHLHAFAREARLAAVILAQFVRYGEDGVGAMIERAARDAPLAGFGVDVRQAASVLAVNEADAANERGGDRRVDAGPALRVNDRGPLAANHAQQPQREQIIGPISLAEIEAGRFGAQFIRRLAAAREAADRLREPRGVEAVDDIEDDALHSADGQRIDHVQDAKLLLHRSGRPSFSSDRSAISSPSTRFHCASNANPGRREAARKAARPARSSSAPRRIVAGSSSAAVHSSR